MEHNKIYRERALHALDARREQTLVLPSMLSRRSIATGWAGLVAVLALMVGIGLLPVKTTLRYQPAESELVRSGDAWGLKLSLPDNIRSASMRTALVSIPALELFEFDLSTVSSNDREILIKVDDRARRLFKTTQPDDLDVTIQFRNNFWQQLTSK